MSLLAAGVLNAVIFRLIWQRRLPRWDFRPPALGRLQAFASIVIWLCTATTGRLIAYL